MMAASSVESQRLISLSLGKIAQSRSQKGGINLHKNLLVATVLHKARTACMMEYQTLQRQRQLEFQQRQEQQQKDAAAALEFEQKQEQARSAALSLAAFNTPEQQQHSAIPTCVREMEEEEEAGAAASSQEVMADTAAAPAPPVDAYLGQVASGAAPLTPQVPTTVADLGHEAACSTHESDVCDKENSPPAAAPVDVFDVEFEEDEDETASQVVPQSVGPLDHLTAATQLAEDAAGPTVPWRSPATSATPTCNVLKRQRDNSTTAVELECPPATKKARLVASRRDSSSSRHTSCGGPADATSSSSSPRDHHQQHTCPDPSQQISNLVTIFNSGFTGLCAVASPKDCVDYSCETSGQYTTLTAVQPDSGHSLGAYSRKVSEPSLSCSSSLGRLDSLPPSMGLVLSV